MALERVAELEVFVEHSVGFVTAELLETCGMDVAVHTGAERAAFEAVAAEHRGVEAGPRGPRLDDPGDGAGVDRRGADPGQGGVAAVAAARRDPDPPEQGAGGNPCGGL